MSRPLASLALALALAAGACAPRYAAPAFEAAYAGSPYQLASGDKLRIIVFGQDNLSNIYAVDGSGRISMPLIGAPGTGIDADDTEVTTDRMTEEELLKGLEGLAPPEEKPEPVEPDDDE